MQHAACALGGELVVFDAAELVEVAAEPHHRHRLCRAHAVDLGLQRSGQDWRARYPSHRCRVHQLVDQLIQLTLYLFSELQTKHLRQRRKPMQKLLLQADFWRRG